MRARVLLFSASIFLLPSFIPTVTFADTIVDSDITENITWTEEGNPYLVQDWITIDEDATLTIEPGVIVQFGSSSGIDVLGSLLATGTQEEPIFFTSSADFWYGINFENQEKSSSLDSVVIQHADTALYDSSSKDLSISNTKVIDSRYGIVADGSHLALNNFSAENISNDAIDIQFESDVTLENITLKNVKYGVEVYVDSKADISNLLVDQIRSEAVAVYETSSVHITSALITNVSQSYAIEAFNDSSIDISNLTIDGVLGSDALSVFNSSKMTVSDSTISNVDGWGEAISVFNSGSLIAENLKISNGTGDGLVVFSGGSVDLQDSIISGFIDGAGIADYGSHPEYGDPPNAISLKKNEITNNDVGLGFYSGNSSYSISNNSIHDNTTDGLEAYFTSPVDAGGNYWGDASGPYNDPGNLSGKGNGIFYEASSTVLFSPWLSYWGTPPPDPCIAADTCVSNVLFLPGIETSRLYYRDAFNIEHQVWEPDYYTDIPYLAMKADGTSKFPLYTKDIVDTLQAHNFLWSTISNIFGNNFDTYRGFETFMDALVASSTVKEWRAYPYDWRYDVRDIVSHGTPTEMPDGNVKQIYIEDVLLDMASSSPTGKVTIVAHSNGGLLAKALALSLGDDASKYIDRIIMVGTPQWGTPAAVGALLHADNFSDAPNLIINSVEVRTAMSGMSSSYGLLPSSAYFMHISDPIVTFNSGGLFSGDYAKSFGEALTSFPTLRDFLADGAGLNATMGSANDLRVPLTLSNTLVDKATATHTALDAWIPSSDITVTAIAGWGQDTVKALDYSTGSKAVCTNLVFSSYEVCADTPELEHTPVTTQDGDNTVVSASAMGNTDDVLYFDSRTFQEDKNGLINHQNLTSSKPIQNVIADLLQNKNASGEQYISLTKPPNGANPIKLRISSHSPVHIVVTDAFENQSGILPIPGTDFSGVKRDISDSSVQVFDDEEYISVPEGGTYQVVASGYADGPTTLLVETINGNGTVSAASTFKNMSTTASSTATFSLDSANVLSSLTIDTNGDGTNDATMTAQKGNLTVYEPPVVSSRATSGHGHSSYTPSIQTVPLIPAVTPLIASTTPATTTRSTSAPISQLPTTSFHVPKRSLVLTSPASVTSTTPNLSQTASAYNSLSESRVHAVMSAVYYWLQNAWSNLLHVLLKIL